MIRQDPLDRIMRFMLTLSGILPEASCVLFWRMYMVVSITFGQYGIYLYIIKRINTVTLWDLMECLSFALAHSKVIFKCLMFWFNQQKFLKILAMMKEDWNDCAHDDVSLKETTRKVKTYDRIARVILILHTLSIIGFSSGVFFANDDITNNVTEVHFNTKIDFPFEINTQRTYKLILVIESLVLFTFSWSTGTVNCMLLILIMHIAGQINIVRRWLTEIAFSENTGKDKSISITMTKIIQKHKKIIRFSKKIQSLYMHIALVQFLLNTIMICAIAFLVVTAVGSPDAVKQIVKCFFFYVTTNLEAYIFCFAGEYLKNKSREIGIAAYSTAWYNMKSKDSRVLLFIILRSQKELTLTAGNMMELSLQSFTSIMNISGSYLSVLLAMR
ncbi:hypothetical protein PUN28_001143 [Cardiocondyla obscurior]|uniref:Odorant receptor n=1 Tax=Cardiocondyla obscurior TaxID=286306 RepID=A0AAW2H3A3_9HYME